MIKAGNIVPEGNEEGFSADCCNAIK